MGYQPVLDGIRAVAVVAVILYHAGFGWMHGGFFGVEVFFVVSGYLITSLLLDEHRRAGKVSLGQFWLRRARRLLPALFAMLAVVAVWASFFGERAPRSAAQGHPPGDRSTSATGRRSSATSRTSPPRRRCCATCGASRWRSSGTSSGRSHSSVSWASSTGESDARDSRWRWRSRRSRRWSFSVALTFSDAPTVAFARAGARPLQLPLPQHAQPGERTAARRVDGVLVAAVEPDVAAHEGCRSSASRWPTQGRAASRVDALGSRCDRRDPADLGDAVGGHPRRRVALPDLAPAGDGALGGRSRCDGRPAGS